MGVASSGVVRDGVASVWPGQRPGGLRLGSREPRAPSPVSFVLMTYIVGGMGEGEEVTY